MDLVHHYRNFAPFPFRNQVNLIEQLIPSWSLLSSVATFFILSAFKVVCTYEKLVIAVNYIDYLNIEMNSEYTT